jgi:clan AA aspartic protease
MALTGERYIGFVDRSHGKEQLLGYVHAKIVLSNPRESDLSPVEVEALVDTGALTVCIPEHLVVQLRLLEKEKREVTTADGRSMLVPYVGPVQIGFNGRTCFTGALVLGDSVLLGSVPTEDMDLVVNLARRTLGPNPKSPYIPHALVK